MSKRIVVACIGCGKTHLTGQVCKKLSVATAIIAHHRAKAIESRSAIQARRDGATARQAREAKAHAESVASNRRAGALNRSSNAYKSPGARELYPTVISGEPTALDLEVKAERLQLSARLSNVSCIAGKCRCLVCAGNDEAQKTFQAKTEEQLAKCKKLARTA